MNKVLIVTYYWPPGSGAGVQRWLKFAKYLPESGWEPVVLTVDPDYATYPATDESLENEIAGHVRVIRTKATDWFSFYRKDKSKIPSSGFAANSTRSLSGHLARFVRGNFFIPDPRKGWNKYALKEASRLIEQENIRHIITTSPPHSSQLIGLELKKCFPSVRWIADLRDPWTDIYYYDSFYHTPFARRQDEFYERKVLRKADRIITVGNSLKASFKDKLPGISDKISVITNGYDEMDFAGADTVIPEIFTISYIGTLSEAYPVAQFAYAVNKIRKSGYKIFLRFAGFVSTVQKELLISQCGEAGIEFRSYVSHAEAISLMKSSSLLLLIIPDHYSNKSILTGKLFEYLASGNPIICIGPPDGDAAEIIVTSGNGNCADYNDADGIGEIIKKTCDSSPAVHFPLPAGYSRKELTRKLASLLAR